MGIGGLLPLLKSIQRHTTLKAYAGQTLGVDGFGWLHRGAIACAYQLANDIPTTAYVQYMITWVRMLQDFGIVPYLVFDGDSVPSKGGTNEKRRQDRTAAKALAQQLERSGKSSQARQEWLKAISITPQMTFEVIQALRKMDVSVVVAPYEADAQLAYLEKTGIINGIISEDSDLLVFGAQRLITKLDKHGSCVEIQRKDFILNRDLSFAGWSDSMFRRMAILSGCDYLPSINRVGLTTAHGYVKKHKDVARILRAMAMSGKLVVPSDYLDKFLDAERTFLYHRVFCPKQGKLVLLNTIPPDLKEEEMPYLGTNYDAAIAVGVACGDLNPRTKQAFKPTSNALLPRPAAPRPAPPSRRQTLQETPTLKPKGSLDSFFKPQRTPLAELDPNSLTPSPSQQRLLARNRNASWAPITAPNPTYSAPTPRRSVSELSKQFPQAQDRSAYLAKAGAQSSYKPSKRQRLCSETEEVSPSKEVKQSRFFTGSDSTPTQKKAQDRGFRKGGFDVWSDDSVEEALLSLAEAETTAVADAVQYPTLPSALLQKHDPQPPAIDFVPESSPVATPELIIDSQSSHGTVELEQFTLDAATSTQSRTRSGNGVLGAADSSFAALLEYHVQKSNDQVEARRKRTFSSQTPEKQAAALASLRPERVKSVSPSIRSPDFEPALEDVPSPATASSTTRFRSLAKTFGHQNAAAQSRAMQSLTAPVATISRSAILVGGSEDAVPTSSPRGDEVSGDEDEGRLPKLDLKSFRYGAD